MEFDRELLLRVFSEESEEHLAGLESGLVALETNARDPEVLKELFRIVHTFKGSAGSMGLHAVAEFAHSLEDVFERLRTQKLSPDAPLVSLLLRAADALGGLVEASVSGADEPVEARLVRGALDAVVRGESPAAAAAPSTAQGRAGGLRVDGRRLDQMLDLVGEIAIARARVGALIDQAGPAAEPAAEAHRELERLFLDLQEIVLDVRLVPLDQAFRSLQRIARDVAGAQQKKIRLEIETGQVELDTKIVEQLRDPLAHMIRNAIAHGIEAPETRAVAGKDPTGRISLRAYSQGASVVVELSDDGRGLDRDRLLERARALGWVGAEERPSNERLDRLIFEAGLSTASEVSEHSGRGVGMDVVRRNIESLRGTIEVQTTPGVGTVFTLRLPLTLAIIQGFRVQVAEQTYVIPLDSVTECLDLPAEEAANERESGIVHVRGRGVPYLRLREHFRLGGARPERESLVVVRHDRGQAALAVDALLGESQTVVKPLGRLFRRIPGVSGSAILGDGRVALILDVPTLMSSVLETA